MANGHAPQLSQRRIPNGFVSHGAFVFKEVGSSVLAASTVATRFILDACMPASVAVLGWSDGER